MGLFLPELTTIATFAESFSVVRRYKKVKFYFSLFALYF